ncbi:MAG: mechanosensitive ion channel family protein [Candidatus Hodarchaeota archaeon]
MIKEWIEELLNPIVMTTNSSEFFALIVSILSFIIFIWITGFLLKFLIRYWTEEHPETKNGAILLVNIVQLMFVLLFLLSILPIFGVPQEFIIGTMAIVATALGVASTSVASNFIGGLYIIITRPFHVGDFIRTQRVEGIVEEIGLNYTKIIRIDKVEVIIPNSNLMTSSLLNFSLRPRKGFQRRKGLSTSDNLIYDSSYTIIPPKEVVRYQFRMELRLDLLTPQIPNKIVKERLNKVCEEFTPAFSYKPTYYFGKYDFRQELFLIITAPDGYTIFNTWKFFIESIMKAIFSELQQGE